MKTLYNETAAAVAQVLDQISATASEIASALQSVFHSTINEVADILQNTIGVAINDVAMALENAYSATAQAVTSALAAIGDTAKEIEGVLSNVFNETVSEIEDALSSFFSSDTISAIGNAFSSFGDDLSQHRGHDRQLVLDGDPSTASFRDRKPTAQPPRTDRGASDLAQLFRKVPASP